MTDTSFTTVFSIAATLIKALLFLHQEKEWKCFIFCVQLFFCCFLFVCFFPSSAELGNGCRLKFNQDCYQTIEVFLEISRFMYILQMLFIVIYKKRHSIASTSLSFVTDLARVLQLPL